MDRLMEQLTIKAMFEPWEGKGDKAQIFDFSPFMFCEKSNAHGVERVSKSSRATHYILQGKV